MSKTQKITYYVFLVLVTVLFLFTSYGKLIGDPTAKAGFIQAHLPIWFMYFIGVCELFGAIGLWIPRLQRFAIMGLLIILLGAVITTAIFQNALLALMPLVVAIVLWILLRLGAKKRAVTAAESY